MVKEQFRVTSDILRRGEFVDLFSQDAHGGQCFFFGAVRKVNHGKNVVQVEYEAYAPLVLNEFSLMVQEACSKWGADLEVRIWHRVGVLRVGEVSVAIGVSAKHRPESFEACRYIIEELKKRSPIWKCEVYDDGRTEWLKGHQLCQH